MKAEAPHVPAAFINAIAEEGTKAEAIAFLQKQWNENCALRVELASARKALEPFAEIAKELVETLADDRKNTMHWAVPTVGQLREAGRVYAAIKDQPE